MIHLYVVLFLALSKSSFQNYLPEGAVSSPHSNSADPASESNGKKYLEATQPLKTSSGRRNGLNILINPNDLLPASGGIVSSSSQQASSSGHSLHSVSHSSSSHAHKTEIQGGMQNSGNQAITISGNLLSQSPVLTNGVSTLGQFGNAGGMISCAAANAEGLAHASHTAGLSNSFSGAQSWSSAQVGGNQGKFIIHPGISGSTSIVNNAASIISNLGSQGKLNGLQAIDQLNTNSLSIGGNNPSIVLQPDYLVTGQNENNFNRKLVLDQTLSHLITNSQTGHTSGSLRNLNSNQNQLISAGVPTISISISNDGIYANEYARGEGQNKMVEESDSQQAIAALPVKLPEFGEAIVGYRPNVQYYLYQPNSRKIIQNLLSVQQIPSFLNTIQSGQVNIQLSRAQIEMYKRYLIRTGLIKLKPYNLIFSNKYLTNLPSMRWMVVNLGSSSECLQPCRNIYGSNSLFGAFTKKPVRLLVPILKIRKGYKKTVVGTQTMLGGLQDISGGLYRMAHDGMKSASGSDKEISNVNNEKKIKTNT